MNPTKNHRNATAAFGSTGIGVVVVWGMGMLGVPVTPEVGAALAGVIITSVLAIGKRGIRGIGRMIWRGSSDDARSPDEEV